jgi:DNA-binding transcriptional regulator YdaS (Cro superfamily)
MNISPIDTACAAVGGPAELARQLSVTVSAVHQWRHGARSVPVERVVQIERLTGGRVRRWDFRPDSWHRIWPELIGTPGAPDVPEQEAAA